jgi:hypothetical protein
MAVDIWINEKFDHTPARQSRNQSSEYLSQRRKGRKGRKKPTKIISHRFYLSPSNLAILRPYNNSVLFASFVMKNILSSLLAVSPATSCPI